MASHDKILLVGSDEFLRLQARSLLDWKGCECVSARGSDAAVAMMAEVRPRLTIVDGMLLWKSDPQCCARLRTGSVGADTPIVVSGSRACPTELVERFWRSEVDDFLLLPMEATQVGARLEAVLAGRGSAAALPGLAWRVVAVAGDDVAMAHRMARLLVLNGYRAWEQGCGAAAQTPARKTHFLVLCPKDGGACRQTLESLRSQLRLEPAEVLVYGSGAQPPAGVACLDRDSLPPEAVVLHLDTRFERASRALLAHTRLPFFCPVEFREAGGTATGRWSSCYSYGIKPAGIFLKTLIPARRGSAVELVIHLSTTLEDLHTTGVVAWSNPHAERGVFSFPVGMGVQFLGMIPRNLAQLIDLCRSSAEVAPTAEPERATA